MGKTVKHPHTLYKHTPAFVWDFDCLYPHCPGVCDGVSFFYKCFFIWSSHYCCSLCLGLCVWVHAGNICAFRGLTYPPQQRVTWAEFIRVPTWSFLDLWGLVKGSNGRKTERALSTAAQLWLRVVSAHGLFPSLLKTACVRATAGLGQWHLGGSPGLVCSVEVLCLEEMEPRYSHILCIWAPIFKFQFLIVFFRAVVKY